jgi:hypothetical protein
MTQKVMVSAFFLPYLSPMWPKKKLPAGLITKPNPYAKKTRNIAPIDPNICSEIITAKTA